MSTSREIIRKNVMQLVAYGVIGVISASIDFAIFYILTVKMGLHYIAANCFSVSVGILTSFTFNRTFNFKVTDKTVMRFGLFFACGMLGLALSNMILWLGVRCCFEETITKIVSIFIVAFVQFLFNKYVTFKQKI